MSSFHSYFSRESPREASLSKILARSVVWIVHFKTNTELSSFVSFFLDLGDMVAFKLARYAAPLDRWRPSAM